MSLLSNFKIFVGILLGATAFRGLREKKYFESFFYQLVL